jgi:hypothetical protein
MNEYNILYGSHIFVQQNVCEVQITTLALDFQVDFDEKYFRPCDVDFC